LNFGPDLVVHVFMRAINPITSVLVAILLAGGAARAEDQSKLLDRLSSVVEDQAVGDRLRGGRGGGLLLSLLRRG